MTERKAVIEATNALDFLSTYAYHNSLSKGFWHEGKTRNKGEMIALMHSELSEALEAIRKPTMVDKHLPDLDPLTIELADVLIRVFDFCGGFNLNLGEAVLRKMEYNATREAMHGKKF